jgi:arylsulfatase A
LTSASCSRRTFLAGAALAAAPAKPNVIVILADDLGYGALGCYGNPLMRTPYIDRLAREGTRFTSAYTPASVCTPARYGLLTGRYPWRTWLKARVIADAPALIEPGRYTLPKLFQDSGYATACFGKWHLGFGTGKQVNFNAPPIEPGPLEAGFDYFFGLPVGHFYPPYVYMENRAVVNADPADPIRIVRSGGQADQAGGARARYRGDDVTTEVVGRAVRYIESKKNQPFFLYWGATNVHMPFEPAQRFRGNSPLGLYGDSLLELDWAVGEVLQSLDRLGLRESTAIVFASDNGGDPPEMLRRFPPARHDPNAPLRGDKGDVLEGGVRIPFLLRWPARVKAGGVSDSPFSFTDLLASFAALLGRRIPDGAAPDSFDVLPALLNAAAALPPHPIVLQSRTGMLGLRLGRWKYIDGAGDGDTPSTGPAQLYHLGRDPNESSDLIAKEPARAAELRELLQSLRQADSLAVWPKHQLKGSVE